MSVKVRVFRNGKVESFDHTMVTVTDDGFTESLTAVIDYFEGQVGTVLTIHGGVSGARLYKGLVNEWDLQA